jgi:septal ring factor EnvC (AmiA/AmiB activator)
MTITSLPLRRVITAIGVVAALLLGFGSIRAAAAWTAASAPLHMAPVSVEQLQGQLTSEQARSADLEAELHTLTVQTAELDDALGAAQARITADSGHATDLAKQLKAAKAKLARLEASIANAKRTVQHTTVVTKTKTVTSTPKPTGEPDDDGGHGD